MIPFSVSRSLAAPSRQPGTAFSARYFGFPTAALFPVTGALPIPVRCAIFVQIPQHQKEKSCFVFSALVRWTDAQRLLWLKCLSKILEPQSVCFKIEPADLLTRMLAFGALSAYQTKPYRLTLRMGMYLFLVIYHHSIMGFCIHINISCNTSFNELYKMAHIQHSHTL